VWEPTFGRRLVIAASWDLVSELPPPVVPIAPVAAGFGVIVNSRPGLEPP
jgi:hypothetical protein